MSKKAINWPARTFDGERYTYQGSSFNREEARVIATRCRQQGFYARVTAKDISPGRRKYEIWTRPMLRRR